MEFNQNHYLFRRPDDWTLSWGGSGQIWGWGHNHRGQLGGVEGAKVKLPIGCEALAGLRPVQLIGGEQTLFAVTGDGKVHVPSLDIPMCSFYCKAIGIRSNLITIFKATFEYDHLDG